jgi:outer membrane protein OmpA-like peptidoglycan-associated protein
MSKQQNNILFPVRALVLSLLFFAFTQSSLAQPVTGEAATTQEVSWPHHLTLGLGAGLNLNFASGTYNVPAPVSNSYTSGFGAAPTFFALLEIPLSESWMLVPRIHYSDYSGSFTDGKATGTATQIADFAYNVQTIGIDILAKYVISGFHILAGPSIATMIKKTYGTTSSEASASSTNLPGTGSLYAAIGAGVGYDIPINSKHTVWLTPEAFYSFPLTNLAGSDNGSLKVSTLRAALSVKFDLGSEPPPPPPPAEPMTATMTARGILPNGDATNDPIIPEQASRTRSSMQMLPYVFFDNGSSEIPARYSRNGATGFSEMQLSGKNELEVNHAALDIWGSRMKQYPDITIKVTGCNSNSGKERNNIELSRARAMAVRDYLVGTWKVDPKRIIVDQRNLPEIQTNPVTKAGMEENRRVEITSSDARINDPVKIENKKSESVGETRVRFETALKNADKVSITGWKITMDQNGTPIGKGESGNGAPPKVISVVIPEAVKYADQPIHCQMEITDANGKKTMTDCMTRVVKKTVEHANLEKYAMLSFDFDKSEVNERAQKMINLIGESITLEANGLNVKGFCDNTGADDYNQALSEARAQAAVQALRSATHLPANTNVAGNGKRDPKFVNELPEGRMLNRRVEVEIAKSNH